MSACVHCGEALDDTVEVHASGRFQCKGGGSWAEAWTPDAVDAQVQSASEEGYEEGYREAEREFEDKAEDAYEEGRQDARDGVKTAVANWRVRTDVRGVDDLIRMIEEALA